MSLVMKKVSAGIIACLLLACLLISCAQQPAYYVDSYDELQAEFADYPQFRFPDKDLCDRFDWTGGYLISYSTEVNGCARSRRPIGYDFDGKFDSSSDWSAPDDFWMRVRDRVYLKSGKSSIEPDEVEPTMWRSGVGIEASRELWEPGEGNSDSIPMLGILYSFDIDGVNYSIRGNLSLPSGSPDDPAARETIAEIELLLLDFVDSIIENK